MFESWKIWLFGGGGSTIGMNFFKFILLFLIFIRPFVGGGTLTSHPPPKEIRLVSAFWPNEDHTGIFAGDKKSEQICAFPFLFQLDTCAFPGSKCALTRSCYHVKEFINLKNNLTNFFSDPERLCLRNFQKNKEKCIRAFPCYLFRETCPVAILYESEK